MNQQPTPIRRALISVSNKTGLVEFARRLHEMDIEIISTGGTSKLLREAKIPVRDVADLTGFPEIMDGRLKTLHPLVHGGILGLRDQHNIVGVQFGIQWIDLVVVNLYPFAETIKKPNVTFDEAIENIDVGGPTMIRAAAKNMGWVTVAVDPHDYDTIITELKTKKSIDFKTRKHLAVKAFGHTADYDTLIHDFLHDSPEEFPSKLKLHLHKHADLRYGENPHQTASAYQFHEKKTGVLAAKQHQGKQLSYNNIADADAAVNCVKEFSKPACVIVKHANPCGVATANTILEAFKKAFCADETSAFGGVIALNRECDALTADAIVKNFSEVIIAPSYSQEALRLLSGKPNVRVLELPVENQASRQEFKFIEGGLLIQSPNNDVIDLTNLQVVTKMKPTEQDNNSLLFAWHVLKHIKSNAILLAKENSTVGVGAGQVSRIDAVEVALHKAGNKTEGAVLASDAFFPFRDSIDRIAKTGVRAIIQPGGSIKDNEVIQACNEHRIAMVFTGKRCFKH